MAGELAHVGGMAKKKKKKIKEKGTIVMLMLYELVSQKLWEREC